MTTREKNHHRENFPVLKLVPKNLRRQVLDFYQFARECDDIADNPLLSKPEKINLLNNKETSNPYLKDLLKAFVQDAEGFEYNTWQNLLDYCQYSAAPVGRYILSLYGENADSDILCAVLQITNHLQDIKYDAKTLDRVYIPNDILEKFNIDKSELLQDRTTLQLKKMLEYIIFLLRLMLEDSRALPKQIKSYRLRSYVYVIISLTNFMLKKIEKGDVLAQEIKLSEWDKFRAIVIGFIKGL